jgi:hypothetical protein
MRLEYAKSLYGMGKLMQASVRRTALAQKHMGAAAQIFRQAGVRGYAQMTTH